jgi:hypothetical protein
MKAFAASYPDRLGQAVLRDGDWAVEMDMEDFMKTISKVLLS